LRFPGESGSPRPPQFPLGGRSRAPLEAGLAFLIATIAVELLDPRRVSALPVDEFGFFAFVIVLGFGLRQDLVDGPYGR